MENLSHSASLHAASCGISRTTTQRDQKPVHFGLVLTLNLAIGQQTPPVASVLIAACAIAEADIWETTKVNLGYIGVLLVVLLICTYLPWLALAPIHWFYGAAAGG